MLIFLFYSNKPNPAVINNSKGGIVNGNGGGAGGEISSGGKACESCSCK